LGKSVNPTHQLFPLLPNLFPVQELIIQEVPCDFALSMAVTSDFERPWFVEVIETDGAGP